MSWDYGILEIAFASTPDAAVPLWTNVTSRLDPAVELVITRGRSTETDDIQNSTLTCALQNPDHYLTPGNPMSPWYPNVKPARRIRYRELIDGITYELFDGYLNFPDIEDWAKADATSKFDQVLNVSAVDRMGRLDRARSFYSVLAEHVRYNGSTGLKAHYPLAEAQAPCYDLSSSTREPLTVQVVTTVGGDPGDLITFDDDAGPEADDVGCVHFNPVIINNGIVNQGLSRRYLQATFGTPVSLATGQVLTLVAWARLDEDLVDDATSDLLLFSTTGQGAFVLRREDNTGGSLGRLGISALTSSGGWNSGNLWGPVPSREAPLLLAARFRLSTATNALELWVNSERYAFTSAAGTPASPITLATLQIGNLWSGTVSNAQIYVATDGAADDYSWSKHLAQLAVGQTGMARQRVDERITILAGYAGVSSTDLQLDTASAIMPAATLAGQKPGAELRVAANADTGLLFASGGGKLVFHSRQRRYNPSVAATVDLLWLAPPWRQRVQPPINVARITGAGSATAVEVNTASVTEYGEYELPDTIETATDADARNLALWYTTQFEDPRNRAPVMVFDLMSKSNTIRHTILGRELSDRINLSGLPANAPEGLNSQFIEGITHRMSSLRRVTEWNTSPMVGSLPGVPATWAQVGVSVVDSTTVIAY